MKKVLFLMFFIASFSNAQSLQNAIKLTDSEQYASADKELRDLIIKHVDSEFSV
jgi:hypothetical protein